MQSDHGQQGLLLLHAVHSVQGWFFRKAYLRVDSQGVTIPTGPGPLRLRTVRDIKGGSTVRKGASLCLSEVKGQN